MHPTAASHRNRCTPPLRATEINAPHRNQPEKSMHPSPTVRPKSMYLEPERALILSSVPKKKINVCHWGAHPFRTFVKRNHHCSVMSCWPVSPSQNSAFTTSFFADKCPCLDVVLLSITVLEKLMQYLLVSCC